MKSYTLFLKMQIPDSTLREYNSVDGMEPHGSVFLMSASGNLTLADKAGLPWGQLYTAENQQLGFRHLSSALLSLPSLLLWEYNPQTHTHDSNRCNNEVSVVRRFLFTSTAELVRTEHTLRILLGWKSKLSSYQIEKKIHEVKKSQSYNLQ